MPYPLPLTRTEAYLAYKAGVIQQSDLKPSLAVPRNGIDAWLAYWTGLAADYPKREDGTPHILQEEEAYIAYLSGVINEYPEKCLRRVGAYLRYLISARWGRPDHPLNREELYLSLIKTQFIPSGDPSSDIVIDGTAKAPFVDVKMYGDTDQTTYTGQNLYNVAGVSTGTYVTKDGDGWITITRDNTSGDSTVYTNVWTSNLALETNTQYKIFIEVKAVSGTGSLFVTSTNSTQGQFNSWQEKKLASMEAGKTYTVSPTTKSSFSGISQGLRTVLEQTAGQGGSVTFRLSVCASSTPTETFSYEPYVGGQPSPNPDYPQPVQTVTGRQVVNVTGKNLYRSDSQTTTWDGASVITDGSEITFTGNSGGNSSMSYNRQEIPISIPSGTTLTVSAKTVSGKAWGSGVLRVGVRLYYSDGTNSNLYIPDYYPSYFDTTKSTTITTSKDVIGIAPAGLSYSAKGITDPVTFVCQLEKGSTATTYEPYSSNDYEINLGKNLFDKNNATISHFYPHVSEIRQNDSAVSIVLPVEAGTTYTASTTNRSLIDSTPAVACTDHLVTSAPDSFLSRTSWGSGDSVSFTAPAGAKYMYLYVKWTTDATTIANVLATIQVEKGSQATTYAPYFEPIELCKLGDYQDYIYKDGESWKVHKEVGQYTFTDTSVFTWGSDRNRLYISQDALAGLGINFVPPASQEDIFYALSNKFKAEIFSTGYATSYTGACLICSSGRTWSFRGGWSDQAAARNALAGTTVDYALATPTDTIITDQTLIAQLEALVAGGAENGTTYIKVNATDPNLPGLLYVEAPKYE